MDDSVACIATNIVCRHGLIRMMRTYRVDRSYDWNYARGPQFDVPLPRLPLTPRKDFLGLPVGSRIGIAAGLLLNSRWIELYARLGFDILTYKTVRSHARVCHPLPNWAWVDHTSALAPSSPENVCRTGKPARDATRITSSVSFGMPSKAPGVWMKDVGRARRTLRRDQVLVVSVVASPSAGDGEASMVDEFARLTAMAREAGAQVVEANLSCPNVYTAEGDIFRDAELSARIARAMRAAAGTTPIALKIGYVPNRRELGRLLKRVSGVANAVVMVNGISQRLHKASDDEAAFGAGRESAGILGRLIHVPSVEAVRAAVDIVRRDRLELEVIGVGGVSTPQDAADFFDAGAHAVLMGSAPMYDPLLALRIKEQHPEW